jgi:hypothetical protein
MVTVAGVKSEKDTGHVPVAVLQVAVLDDPSGAVTTTVTGVCAGAPVTSTTRPVQPIKVHAVGPIELHLEPRAATSKMASASGARGIIAPHHTPRRAGRAERRPI